MTPWPDCSLCGKDTEGNWLYYNKEHFDKKEPFGLAKWRFSGAVLICLPCVGELHKLRVEEQ